MKQYEVMGNLLREMPTMEEPSKDSTFTSGWNNYYSHLADLKYLSITHTLRESFKRRGIKEGDVVAEGEHFTTKGNFATI